MDLTNSNLQSVTTDSEEKSNIAIPHKPSVKSYATRVFQESTVGIVSSIFTTHSKYRRFFKVLLSSLCITGFIYHCVTFLNHVFEYPEVMDIYQNRSKTYNWPAYTYCPNNPIRRSVFCSQYSQYCIKPSEEFCKKYSSYCGTNATLIPKEKYYYYLPDELQGQGILKFGSDPNLLKRFRSYLKMENEADEISGPYLRFSGSHRTTKACYSIHSRIESNLKPVQKIREENEIPFVEEWIEFYIDETEMMHPRSEPGVYFSIHSPFEFVNPLKTGIFLKGGRTYRLYVEMQEEVLLKEPFESNCMDYDELWVKNNHTGPRTKKMCREKCHLDYDRFRHDCVSTYIHYPHKERSCDILFQKQVARNGSFSLEKCLKNCPAACRSPKYTTQVSEQDYIEGVKFAEQHRNILVYMYLSNDEIQVLRHSPKYEAVDVISSVGGFMGCWLGIALMDILDVFGSIITVCRYAFRKRLNKEN